MKERFLEGRTALVIGSVQGIGLAIARALASAGARVAVHGLATREQANAAVRTMREVGAPDARFFDADMRKPTAIESMMESVISWGRTGHFGEQRGHSANRQPH
jgi:3-hydroxybutyrate dehydrogenase